jgi:hypothetical protein
MFSPDRDLRELITEVLKMDPASISGISRKLAAKGVKIHRLELTGYLKALADLNILKEKDIKPAKVFSMSTGGERSLYQMIGDSVAAHAVQADRATLATYCLQKLFRRAVFEMEVRRCGIEGTADGRKATPDERSDAKSILTRIGYKVPNSDIPTIVEADLEDEFVKVLTDVMLERFNMRTHTKETVQTKL